LGPSRARVSAIAASAWACRPTSSVVCDGEIAAAGPGEIGKLLGNPIGKVAAARRVVATAASAVPSAMAPIA